jgi:dihydrolipoamide dehydrogenase
MKEFQTWKTEVVSGLNGGVRQLLKTAGVEVRQGFFRFTRKDQGVLEYGEAPPTHIQFKNCIIATGSRPTVIPGLPRDGKRILDSSDVLALEVLPKSIAVVGGGYIGVELGTALAQLGSKVTMIEAAERLLPSLQLLQLKQPPTRPLRSSCHWQTHRYLVTSPSMHQQHQAHVCRGQHH